MKAQKIQNPVLRDLLHCEQLRLRISDFCNRTRWGKATKATIVPHIVVHHCVTLAPKVRKYYGRTFIKQCRRYHFLIKKVNREY